MVKIIVLIVVGVTIGYWIGWKDAQTYRVDIVTRVVDRVGGSNRDHFKTDVDANMERLER